MQQKEAAAKPTLVSVVIPVYNTDEAYLTCCVQSVWNQNYSDLQVILVDDGSQPETAALCDALAAKDSRTQVIHRTNGGLSVARNTGIETATGKYVCFLDSDDVYHPDFVRLLLEGIESCRADVAVCDVWIGNRNDPKFPVLTQPKTAFFSGEDAWKKSKPGYCWNKLYRRDWLDQVRFAPGLAYEDFWFSANYAMLVNSSVQVQEKLIYYRVHNASLTGKMTPQKYQDAMNVCDWVSELPRVAADRDYGDYLQAFRGEWQLRYMVALARQKLPAWKTLVAQEQRSFVQRVRPYKKYATKFVAVSVEAARLPACLFRRYLDVLYMARRWKRRV